MTTQKKTEQESAPKMKPLDDICPKFLRVSPWTSGAVCFQAMRHSGQPRDDLLLLG